MLNRLARSFAPALVLAMLPVASFAGIAVGVSINIAPPLLPVYVQPAPPAADYIWTPGYWAYGDDGYYWVPGTWVLAPEPGLLWTPGYWGWEGGGYLWHGGYWGPHVGFYGGVNYGFGYGGVGFQGGYWRGGHVVYNRSVTNVTNINVTNVYNKTVVVHNVNHVSFNGGNGGINTRPSAGQLAAEHDHHFDPTPMQRQHIDMAAKDRDLRASVNNGRPHIAATARPAAFTGRGVVAARGVSGPHPGGPGSGGPGSAHPVGTRTDRPPQAQHDAMHHAESARAGEIRADRPPVEHHAQAGSHPNGGGQPHSAPHPNGGPHPEGAPHPNGGPHPEGAPHPNGGPHPEGAPHPNGGEQSQGGHPQSGRPEGRGQEHPDHQNR